MWKLLPIIIFFSYVAVCSASDEHRIWANGTKCERKLRGVCISKATMDSTGCPFVDPRTTPRGCPKKHICCVPSEKVTARKVIPGICGKPPLFQKPSKDRIVGGYGVKDGEIPWQVLLREERFYTFASFPPDPPFCGGSIIDKNWILTAAHCFGEHTRIRPDNPKTLRIATGVTRVNESHLRNDKIQVRHVSKIILHEKYEPDIEKNDIALLKLTKPLNFNDYSIPVCLPDKAEKIEGIICTVSGWGVTGQGVGSTYLRALNIPIIPRPMCEKIQGKRNNSVFETNVCSMFVEGGRDACGGDSGGPLACRMNSGQYILGGVVSWGDAEACAMKKMPGVYTKVADYIDWIKKTTGI